MIDSTTLKVVFLLVMVGVFAEAGKGTIITLPNTLGGSAVLAPALPSLASDEAWYGLFR